MREKVEDWPEKLKIQRNMEQRTDAVCYGIGWCLIGLLALYFIFCRLSGIGFLHFSYPCLFHAWTGYYCPGCGGTRAVYALLRGDFLLSFRCHPIVPSAAAAGAWFMLSQTAERISGGRCRIGMHFRNWYLWLALALITVNFLVKNLALIFWKIDLLAP